MNQRLLSDRPKEMQVGSVFPHTVLPMGRVRLVSHCIVIIEEKQFNVAVKIDSRQKYIHHHSISILYDQIYNCDSTETHPLPSNLQKIQVTFSSLNYQTLERGQRRLLLLSIVKKGSIKNLITCHPHLG